MKVVLMGNSTVVLQSTGKILPLFLGLGWGWGVVRTFVHFS